MPKLTTAKVSILIVDDESQLAINLADFLSDLGMTTDVAYNGAQALEKLNLKPFDIVITDFTMPEMDGLELIKRIKANSAFDSIKIILMTGNYDSKLSEALSMCNGHMFKPFDLEHLTAVIESFSIQP